MPAENVSGSVPAAARIAQAFADLKGGQLEQARAVFADLMHDPQHGIEAYRGLAAVAWQQKQGDTAIQLLRLAVQQQPEHVDAQADLALVLLTAGRAEESLPHWDQRLRLTPGDAMAWHNFGQALATAGRLDQAVPAFEQALTLTPQQAQTYETYARALTKAAVHDRAEAVWRRGLERFPKMEVMYHGLAGALFDQSLLRQCMEVFRAGVAALPESPDLHMGLGQLLDDLGDKAAAEVELRRALELRPGWAQPVEALLTLLRKDARDEDVELARRILDDPLRSPQDHANAGFGLGKTLDGRGDYDGAFAVWNKANAARRQQIGPFDRAGLTVRVDRNIAQFTRAFLEQRRTWGSDSNRPVFVLGMPRSGTTLVEQILASHPDAYGCGELTDLSRVSKAMQGRIGTIQPWPEAAAALTSAVTRAAADDYLGSVLKRYRTDAKRLVDKAPVNFFYIGLIALLFPKARIIWCRRDPRDIATSIYSENFGLTQKQATDLSDIGFFYKEHMRLMRHWSEVAREQIYECRYEDLIADFEPQCRGLVEGGAGLPWDERCLRFHESDRAVLTPSRWQVRSPIYKGALGRWKRYEKHLGPLLEALQGEI
ncbi:MAG TPA: sulfotransferase [Verrucomicrobiae bacterium]|nr:sulfotransferase [Verrucomicrobiae bacterium]